MAVKIALAGNPNCGKTTLFNALTGSNQFVGNWPGVTVEKKEGKLKKSFMRESDKEAVIMDLPGIYSLSPYTLEEVVARDYLIKEKPDVILNIVDGTNMERNLYLSTQLMELGIPMVMAVNMTDVLEKNGDKVHIDKMSNRLGVKAVAISALKGKGIKEAAQMALEAAEGSGEYVKTTGNYDKKNYGNAGEKAVENTGSYAHQKDKQYDSPNSALKVKFSDKVEEIIKKTEDKVQISMADSSSTESGFSPVRFFAIKLLEKDDKIGELMKEVPDVSAEIEEMEKAFDDDTESIITNERYVYISSIISECITKKKQKLTISDRIDKVVTNRWLALPIFAVIMFLVYYISVTTIGAWATDWTNDGLFGDGWHLFGIGTSQYEEEVADYAINNIWTEDVKETVSQAADNGTVGAEDILSAIEDEDFAGFEEAYGSYNDSLLEEGYDITGTVDAAMENAPDTADYGVWVPGIPALIESGLDAVKCSDALKGLILDGIVGGVGAVLGFVPQMLVLFILLAFLEACGYMARVAFIMDRIFRKFGLSGKSFIPMLIGSGCGVPGIMASRTIENDRDRKMTIMTTTFIPCGAKLPIIALIAAALFNNGWWVAPSAYFIGIAAIICSGIILKKTKMFAGEPAPFVMELPAYHWPTVGNVLRSMWERGWSFIKKAGTIILLSSIIIWVGSCFGNTGNGFGFSSEMELEDSVLGMIGNAIKWLFAPLGFGNIRAVIATIMGLVAKEEVVGVFGVIDFEEMTRLAAYSFLVFNLLCAPCFAAMGAIKREMNNAKWFWFAIGYQTVLAYVVSLCIYQLGNLFANGVFGVGTVAALILAAGFIYLLVRPYRESGRLDVKFRINKKENRAGVR